MSTKFRCFVVVGLVLLCAVFPNVASARHTKLTFLKSDPRRVQGTVDCMGVEQNQILKVTLENKKTFVGEVAEEGDGSFVLLDVKSGVRSTILYEDVHEIAWDFNHRRIPHNLAVKNAARFFPNGKKAVVLLAGGRKITGRIGTVGDTTFEIEDSANGALVTVNVADVQKGPNLTPGEEVQQVFEITGLVLMAIPLLPIFLFAGLMGWPD